MDRAEQGREMEQGHQAGYQLSLLKVPVAEVGRSARFYHEALGLAEEFVAEEYGWAQMRAGDVSLALYVPGRGGGDGHIGGSTGFHLSLPPDRFDALAADLLGRGALVEDMVHRADDGGVFIDVSDPDGNIIKVVRDGGD